MKPLFILLALAYSICLGQDHAVNKVQFPTDNRNLLNGKFSQFYMYTDRYFEGVRSKPWQGGLYGFSRNQKRHGNDIIMTRFHEGVDIRPLYRDGNQVPQDLIKPISPGKVVHVNDDTSKSSYGKYLVIEHDTYSGKLYSLYAHLASIWVKRGKKVTTDTTIGRLGYTGNGLNKERAHLHIELNLLISKDFEDWHGKHYTSPSHHDIYNGINMVGLPLHHFFKSGKMPYMAHYRKQLQPYYTAIVKRTKNKPTLIKNYPWLLDGQELSSSPSWEITLTGSGIPLKMVPSQRKVSEKYPQVAQLHTHVRYPHSWQTKGRLTGTGSKAQITPSGVRYLQLLTEGF